MSSIPCSRATIALLFVAVLVAAVGPASALSLSSEGVPESSQVGEEIQVTYTIDDPFTDAPNEWTLQGETELEDVRWTVTVLRAGTQVSQETYTEQSFNHSLDVDDNGDEVVVNLDGTTPAIENYTYSPEETYRVTSLDQRTGGNVEELTNDSAHHYTGDSQEARNAIEDAETAIDEIGGHDEAETTLNRAITLYEAERFSDAVEAAEDAQEKAENAQQSQQTLTMALMGGGVLLVLALIGGGVYYWKSQQETVSRL
ncbi:tetratricopeptide repeat protein [Halobacteria archaeon HArc-gm2]|nr:tetratricopeptide repeat protein [Halobacteria archaeon HArc-gm2]